MRNRALEMYDAGSTTKTISLELGIPRSTIQAWITRRPERTTPSDLFANIIRLHKGGAGVLDIAREFHLHPHTVRAWLLEAERTKPKPDPSRVAGPVYRRGMVFPGGRGRAPQG
jgi:transposase-like protein